MISLRLCSNIIRPSIFKGFSSKIFSLSNCSTFSSQQKAPDNHFGFKNVLTQQKQSLVNQVFHSVANKYDVMNDVMSMGIHRVWKNHFVSELGNLNPTKVYTHLKQNPVRRVLDVAGGTGDISFRILDNHNHQNVKCTVLDINQSMLDEGQKRANQMGLPKQEIEFLCANAELLPFEDNTFDAYTISFGLRNVPRTRKALEQALRVLKPGGRFMCLQFSKVQNTLFRQIYRQYSFHVIPKMGEMITNDAQSYQYLVESIEKFLTQEQLLEMMEQVGMKQCSFENLTDGVVALHSGFKL